MKVSKYSMFMILCFMISLKAQLPYIISRTPLQCDWTQIDTSRVSFPEYFKWGAATSAFQIEGTITANNKHVQNSWTQAMDLGNSKTIGSACDHWNRYKEDVQLIKNIGLQEYRFSIKWSAVMPREFEFDQVAMDHYVDLVRELIQNDINPYIMLFHHAWPLWFDKKGAFEKSQNMNDFFRFAMYVFTTLQKELGHDFKRIKWMTFNEPVGYCIEGYFRGKYPPYKKSLKLAGVVLKNMLDAHVALYRAFKDADSDAQIGFAHVVVPVDPYRAYHPVDVCISKFFDYLQNYTILTYFTTGAFTWGFPGYARFVAKNKDAIGALDFIAVNYYFNVMLRFQCLKPKVFVETFPGRLVWGEHKAVYPEGLYRAIANVANYLPGVPLIIGENGIATDNSDWRDLYIKQHLYVVNQLIKDGYDIRAYHWWALMDTYSWTKGTLSSYGFYAVNPTTFERTLRDGFGDFIHLIKTGKYVE